MQFFVPRAGIVVLFLSFLLPGSNLQAQEIVGKITGHQDTSAWALHEASGRIFAAVKSTDSVTEYDSTGKEVRTFSVEPEPTGLILKGDRLVVACSKNPCFSVIDLKTNKVTGKVDLLAGNGPAALFCSKVPNSLVYCFCKPDARSSSTQLFQVDVSKLVVKNQIEVRGWGQSAVTNVAMSANGKWIVPDGRGRVSPSGADLMKVDEAKCEFTQVRDHHKSFGQIEAGPASRYWMLGGKLYSIDLQKAIRSFGFSVAKIHPTYDLVATLTPTKLKIQTFTNAKLLGSAPMDFVMDQSKKAKRARSRSPVSPFEKLNALVGYDLKGSNVVVAAGSLCRVVSLDSPEIPLTPVFLLDVPREVEAVAKKTVKIPLRLTNSSLESGASFEIKNGPDTAKIVDKHLVWTPADKDLGRHSILLAAKLGDESDEFNIEFSVKSDGLELDFNISGLHVDREGKYAIAWGPKIPKDRSGRRTRSASEPGSDEVAVLDLETKKVVVQRPLAAGVRTALIQSPYVFLMPKEGNVIFRFDRDSLDNSKRMFLKDKGVGLVPYFSKTIGVMVGDHNITLEKIDPESMKSTGSDLLGYDSNYRNGRAPFTEVAPGILKFKTKLTSMSDGSIKALYANPGLETLASSNNNNNQFGMSHRMHGRDQSSMMFGRYVLGTQILTPVGTAVAQFRNSDRAFYPTRYAPVAFSVRTEEKRDGRTTQYKTYLETLSLVDGAVLDSRVFDVTNGRRSRSFRNRSNSKMFYALEDRLVYAKENQIFIIPVVKSVVEKAPMPLHFPPAEIAVLGVDKIQKVNLRAKGGKGNIEYQLISQYPGLEIDAASGEVSIDTPAMWEKYLTAQTTSQGIQSRRNRMRSNSQKLLDGKQYAKMFGKALPQDYLALLLPIQVSVTDEEAQEDRLSVYAVVHAPKNDIDVKLAEIAQRRKAAQAEQDKRRNEQMAAQRLAREKQMEKQRLANAAAALEREKKLAAQPKTEGSDIESRFEALEKRSRRMEATLDAVLKKLEELQKAQEGK